MGVADLTGYDRPNISVGGTHARLGIADCRTELTTALDERLFEYPDSIKVSPLSIRS
jgi:hypothetical protein